MSLQDPTLRKTGITNNESQQLATERQGLRALIAPWWKATLAILPPFIITRILFALLTYLGAILFVLPNYATGALSLHDIIFSWNRWDAIRFATIASRGYTKLEYAAFFPLFPALSQALSAITQRDALLCGMVISNVAFFGTLIVLYRLVETEFDRDTARRTVLYLSVFPTALFFFAGYDESLFLFFTLLCFYTLRRGHWGLAGLFGGLATLTRSIGLLLFVVFLYEYLRQQIPQWKRIGQGQKRPGVLRTIAGSLASLLIPLGLGIYVYGLYVRFGDPLAFTHAQVYWREGLTVPWEAPLQAIKFIVTTPLFSFYTPHNIIDPTAFVFFLVLIVLALVGPERVDRNQWAFILFGLLALLYPLFFPGIPGPNPPPSPYDPLPSMQRFVLEIFIGFIILARLGRHRWFHEGYLLFALPMLAFFTLQFITGHWTI